MRKVIALIYLLAVMQCFAQTSIRRFSFPDDGVGGGEVQSCVITPTMYSKLKSPRVVFSSDNYIRQNQHQDFIYYYDVPEGGGKIPDVKKKTSKINIDEIGSNYLFGTNDHDIVVQPNGHIIFAVGCFSKKDAAYKPGWWNDTYRDAFGSGARTAVAFWKSVDGGENFSFSGIYDPLINGPVIAAYPQFRRDYSKPGAPIIEETPWDMGGSDGQVTKVLRMEGNKLFLSFGIVGYNGDEVAHKFVLSKYKYINKTVLVISDDDGKTWKVNSDQVPSFQWRGDMATLITNNTKYFALNTWYGVIPAIYSAAANKYEFADKISDPGNISGWDKLVPSSSKTDSTKTLDKFIYANMWTYPLIGKCPDKPYFIVGIPSIVNNRRSLRVYMYDPVNDSYIEKDPIVPASNNNGKMVGSTVFHPVMIESNGGPLLIYWTDADENKLSYQVKCRVYYNDKEISEDLAVSDEIKFAGRPWYGDYNTAGSYTSIEKAIQIAGRATSDKLKTVFYPIWFNGGSLFFSEVTVYTNPSMLYFLQKAANGNNLQMRVNDNTDWKKAGKLIPSPSALKKRPDEIELKPIKKKKIPGIID